MRWQTTAVLALLVAALAVFYYVYEVRLGPERARVEAQKGRVFTAELADVAELEIHQRDQRLRVAREGDGWQIVEPLKARGDRARIDDALTTFLTARIDREIDPTPSAAGEFGLDPPAVEVLMRLKDDRRLGLQLGTRSPTGAWVYARETGKTAVIALSESVLRDATRPVAEFRDRTVVRFDRKDVTGLEIVLPDATLTLEQQDGRWHLTGPRSLAADATAVGNFLEKLETARASEFAADAPKSLAPFGLDKPVRIAIHTGRDKDRATRTVLLGRLETAKKAIYAMRPDEPSVLLVPDAVWAALPKTVAAARNKQLLDFETDKVSRLDLETPSGAVSLERKDNRWQIVAPEALRADQVIAGALVFQLRQLRAQAFVAEEASGIGRYLAKPQVRATLTLEGASEPTTVLLAPSPERRGGAPSAYAAVAGRGPVVLVDAKALGEIGRSLTELRDRTLLSGLEPRDVKRVRVRTGQATVVVERAGEDRWKLLEPARGSAKTAAVDDLLFMLRALKWKEIASPDGADAPKYGLDAPALEVALLRGDGSEIATVLFGKQEGGVRWIQTKATPAIYAVEARLLGELPKVPDDFKG